MKNIKFGRVILGGLLAGLIINAGEYLLNVVLLGREWDSLMTSLNRPVVGGMGIVMFNIATFLFAIAMVLLYTKLRPQFQSWKKSAFKAAFFAWFFAYVIGFGWSYIMTIFTAQIYFTTLIWSLFEVSLASLAGAWVYKRG